MIKAKQNIIGILAHVDAGKTTLTEAVLYKSGAIRRLGRVDNKDSWFDSHEIERSRGITVFSKQNPFTLGEKIFTLIDTPGHTDFSAEAQRTFDVLDYAVLVVDGTNGVCAHTEIIWDMLCENKIPTFVFVNKIDRDGVNREELIENLRSHFGSCADFTQSDFPEDAAVVDDELTEDLLSEKFDEDLWQRKISHLVAQREIFPCVFGSALHGAGVDRLLEIIEKYTCLKEYPDEFGARVYKIFHDNKGNRLSFVKIIGGKFCVKDFVGEEKADEIRIYSGEKYESVKEVFAGDVCAVSGLKNTLSGEIINENGAVCSRKPKVAPMLSAQVIINDSTPVHTVFASFKILNEEMPEISAQIKNIFGEEQINICVMGKIQLEILQALVRNRFGIDISFGECSILYKETIASSVMGYGHYEPLKHYAEVQLRLESAPRGSGVTAESECGLEILDSNFQNLVLTHILEKQHIGVLTGSPITDVKIVLTAGRSHLKHTEGGDFREATYRAIRQGLEKAQSVLLEPYYAFELRVPLTALGRAISDIQKLGGEFEPAVLTQTEAVIKGSGPVSEFMDYSACVTAYTGGKGQLLLRENGYRECRNAAQVIEKIGYKKENDLENTSSSIFCSHGAGFEVKWYDVDRMRHIK